MRQIFTSHRLENVQAVSELLIEAGIPTRLTHARSWNRATKRDFSYANHKDNQTWPAVWVVNTNDFSRARQILREQGIELPTTKTHFHPLAVAEKQSKPKLSLNAKIRLSLIAVALILVLLNLLRSNHFF
jgi:hypothetical protein